MTQSLKQVEGCWAAGMADASTVIALQHASKVFGYTSFNETQIKAINGFVCGRDVFVMVPTGGGKSACFTSLPLVFDKCEIRSVIILY